MRRILFALSACAAVLATAAQAQYYPPQYQDRVYPPPYQERPYQPQYQRPYSQPYGGGGGYGPRCGDLVSTQETATRYSPEQVRAIAIDRWRNEAAGRYGPAFADFRRARAANVTCDHLGYALRCTAMGYPCR